MEYLLLILILIIVISNRYEVYKIQKGIKIIMATEAELDQQLTDLAQTATDGFAAISQAVSDAADRVIKALAANAVDLTDEIASVQGIKDAVASSAADATAKLAEIAPDNVPAP